MDIKQAIREVAWMSRMTTAASNGDVFKKAIRNLRIKKQLESIDAWADMAKAAIAHAEFQVSSHSRNGDDAPMDGATYIRERGRLWDAFMAAHKAAKDVNQS